MLARHEGPAGEQVSGRLAPMRAAAWKEKGMITIVLADDHPRIRQAVRAMLDMEGDLAVVAEAADGVEALALVEKHQPDILVVDIAMPGLTGLEVIEALERRQARTRSVVLSMCANEVYVHDAMRLGAMGYVIKDSCVAELVTAVRQAASGRQFFGVSPALAAH